MRSMCIFIICSLSVVVLTTSGCVQCKCCDQGVGSVICIKGTDTVNIFSTGWTTYAMNDSISYYQQRGFTCSSNIEPPYPHSFCGPNRNTASAPYFCTPPIGSAYGGTPCPW